MYRETFYGRHTAQQTLFGLSYLLHPISLNMNKFETDTPTEEKLT